MDNAPLIDLIKSSLQDNLSRKGSILHSPSDSLIQGDYYFIGYNPGGDHHNLTLTDELTSLFNKPQHRYLDYQFEHAGRLFAKGQAPLQKNYQALFNYLTVDPRKVFCTNLIFFHSRKSDGVNYQQDAEICWPIHLAFLAIVKPRVIICNGNGNSGSAYSFLQQALPLQKPQQIIATVYSTAYIKTFTTLLNKQAVLVIGIPHLSRFYPSPYMNTIKNLIAEH